MTTKQIIDGLKFTIEMFLLDPMTNERKTKEQLNDMDRTTVDACKGAIKALQTLEQVEQIITDTEEIVNDSGESTYTQKCAMLRAYEEIVELIGGKG